MVEHAELKDLVIVAARSFLQYADEACLWTNSAGPQLAELAARQRQDVGRLVAHLQQTEPGLDLGTYPTSYTDLHFIALTFLAGQLVENQTSVVEQIDQLLTSAIEESPEAALLSEILANEREILDSVKALSADGPSTPAPSSNG